MNETNNNEQSEEKTCYEYKIKKEPGTYIGVLDDMEHWHRKDNHAMICKFTTLDNEKIALFAWRHRYPRREIYAPREGEIDFAHDVDLGTVWRLTVKNGGWESAELLTE